MMTYKAKSGRVLIKQSLRTLNEAVMRDDGACVGFCLACGVMQEGVEPDARRYRCEECGESKVYGAEELLLLGIHY